MVEIRFVTDLDECEQLWRRTFPETVITDLWEVRACFQSSFDRPPRFLVAENSGRLEAMLPLSWIVEAGCSGYFPGETWKGKTWLEQNRVFLSGQLSIEELVTKLETPRHIRYLISPNEAATNLPVDEIGYLFHPPKYDFDFENYFGEFSHRSAKRLRREIESLDSRGTRYRYDDPSDFDHLVALNLSRFGSSSYFHDPRFRRGFEKLKDLLQERGWLRITTVIMEDEIAAVDLGSLYRGAYTLLAGGTNGDFPGVAKLINVHHMQRACKERMEEVDFLCGDFSWKTLFHLTPRPLFLISNVCPEEPAVGDSEAGSGTSHG
ncbi:MAG: GNAT family N-acetyltransferase [Planctomycetota bacterium]|nr:GNAT family N-acetyltransferase [Planctomycetota bacterium]MDA1137598.1 GNAT family N-acetyltransferase [Planctomycetota bacterium]